MTSLRSQNIPQLRWTCREQHHEQHRRCYKVDMPVDILLPHKWTHTFFCYEASSGETFPRVDNYASIFLVKMDSKYKAG